MSRLQTMPIKGRGVVLSEPRGGEGGGVTTTFYCGVREPSRKNFEIGVLKSAFQCILSNHGFVLFSKESNFTEKNIHVM